MTGNIRDADGGIESAQSTAHDGRGAVSRVGQGVLWTGVCIGVLVLASSLFAGVAAADGPVDLDPDTDLDGDGTEGSPYIITNASELQSMQGNLTAHYELGETINATNTLKWHDGDGLYPIGNHTGESDESFSGDRFEGSLDGNGYAIENLTINRGDESYIGLFGYATDSTTVGNLTLTNATVSGAGHVGALVGESHGEIYETTVDGTVTTELSGNSPNDDNGARTGGVVGLLESSGTVHNTTASADVTGTDRALRIGGLVGYSFGDIRDSKATGDVDGDNGIGGLIGRNVGHIENVTVTGNVTGSAAGIGGLAGYNGLDGFGSGTVTQSHATGMVTASGADQVGGLIGSNILTVNESYAAGAVEGDTNVGGLVGRNSESVSRVNATYATGAVEGDTNVGGFVGYNRDGLINESYAIGAADGTTDVGGFVGANSADADITYSYWDAQATIVTEDGDVADEQGVGSGDDSGVTALRTTELTGQNAEPNMDGFDFAETWMVDPADPENGRTLFYPVFRDNTQVPAVSTTLYADGNGTVTDPYQIADWVQLDNVRETLNANFTLVNDLDTDTTGYETIASENANDDQGFDPIGNNTNKFVGSLDGNGNEIHELTINRTSDDVGLIGFAGSAMHPGAHLTNLTLTNVDVTGNNSVGALVGNSSKVTVNNVTLTGGTVEGHGDRVGGVAGVLTANQNINRERLADSQVRLDNVTGGTDVGGAVGTTELSGASLQINTVSVNTTVEGYANVGGLVGQFSFNRIENVTTAGSVTASTTGTANAGGIVGLSESTSTFFIDSSSTATVSSPGTNVGGAGGYIRNRISGVVATGNVTGGSQVGGLIGKYDHPHTEGWSYATGTVSNASASGEGFGGLIGEHTGSGTLMRVFASGDVTGHNNTGGLVGSATATNGDIDQVHATGSVTGVDNVGGLVGWSTTDEIETTYAAGVVSGESNTGGLVGNTTSTAVISSYWDTVRTTQSASAGGGEGLRTYQMAGDEAPNWMVLTNSNVFETVNETNAAGDGYLVLADLDREPQLLYPDFDRPEFVSAEVTNSAPDEIRVEFDSEVTLNDTAPTDGFAISHSTTPLPVIESATASNQTVVLSLDRSVQVDESLGLRYDDAPGRAGGMNVRNTEGDEAVSFLKSTNDPEFENNVVSGGSGGGSSGGGGGGGDDGGPAPAPAVDLSVSDDDTIDARGGRAGDVVSISDETTGHSDSLGRPGTIAVDSLAIELATDRDFWIHVETFERGQEDEVDATDPSRSDDTDADDEPTNSTRSTIAATFENETGTVSVGYVTVSHNLEPEDVADVNFNFSVSQSYLDDLDVDPEDVSLYRQADSWSTVSTEYSELSASRYRFDGNSPGFSSFAIGTNAPLSIVVNGTLDQSEITEGETATVTATVTNRGENRVTHTVDLTAGDEVVATETITVDGGETVEVPLEFDPAAGAYEMAVDDVNVGSLTVVESASNSLWPIVVALAASLIGMFVWRRRTHE